MKNPKQSTGRTTSSHKTSSSAAATPLNPNTPKSFYESSKNPPSKIPPSSNPDVPGPSIPPPPLPPPPPPYSFHNLDRRTIFLADGTIRSYFALPPDYQMDHNFFHSSRPQPFDPFEGPAGSSSLKRKYGEEEFVRQQQRQQQQQQRPVGEEGRMSKQVKLGGGVDEKGLKEAFLRLSKSVNESLALNKKGGLEDGKSGPLHCIVCGRFNVTEWNFFFFCIFVDNIDVD